MNKDVKKTNPPIVQESRGYPVEPGQTWHDLSREQRQAWMYNHENRWKKRYAAQGSSMKPDMGWTRG